MSLQPAMPCAASGAEPLPSTAFTSCARGELRLGLAEAEVLLTRLQASCSGLRVSLMPASSEAECNDSQNELARPGRQPARARCAPGPRDRSMRSKRLPTSWFFDVAKQRSQKVHARRRPTQVQRPNASAQTPDGAAPSAGEESAPALTAARKQQVRGKVGMIPSRRSKVQQQVDRAAKGREVQSALSEREKADLQEKINALDEEQLTRALQLLQHGLGVECLSPQNEDEVQLDLEKLSPSTQRRFRDFINKEFRGRRRKPAP